MAYEYDPDDKFGYKDTLPENHPEKVITGVEFDDEFKKIEAGMGDLQIEIDAIVDGGSIDEAPVNGLIYGRKDKSWVEVSGAGGGIEEAPETGKPYARKNKSWVESVENGHTHEIADIDGLQDAIDGLAAIDHTHEIEDVDGLNDALDNLAEKITAVTSDIVFGGTYDLANGVVLRSNKEFLVEGQPLPAAADAPDVFLIVTSDGTFEGEALIRSDWIVSDGVTWIPIPYSSTGSVSWENIVDKPAEFPPSDHNHDGDYAPIGHNHDADYAPIAHNHDLDYAPIDHNHDGDYQPVGDYVTEAPNDGKPYVRKDEGWHEMPSTGGGGGDSLWEQNLNDIYYNDGRVGIGIDNPSVDLEVAGHVKFGDGNPWVTSTNILKSSAPAGTDGAHLRASVSTYEYPTYANSNDTDTGMFFPESDALGFSTGATERMRIDASGRVGIGTDSPASYARLTVEGSILSRSLANGVNCQLNTIGSAGLIQTSNMNGDALPLLFYSGGTEAMRIDASGNVGIGTNDPRNKASIVSSDEFQLHLSNLDPVTDYGSGGIFMGSPSGSDKHYYGTVRWDQGPQELQIKAHSGSANGLDIPGGIVFSTNGGTTDPVERMRIDASGNVGIGGPNPGHMLSVVQVNTSQRARASFADLDGRSLEVGAWGYSNRISCNNSRLTISTSGVEPIAFDTNGSERLLIDASGNVNIGASAPVAGGRFFDIYNTGTNATDFSILRLITQTAAGGATTSADIVKRKNGKLEINNNETDAGASIDFAIASSVCMTVDAQGRVGIGGVPSRSTKEIEEEAEATLRNWDSKDKKPTKAELIKRLAERSIGGGDAKLQVAGDGYFSGDVNAGTVISNGRTVIGSSAIYDNYNGNAVGIAFMGGSAVCGALGDGSESDGIVSIGRTDYRFKDAHFSGAVNAAGVIANDFYAHTGIYDVLTVDIGRLRIQGAYAYNWSLSSFSPYGDAQRDLGEASARFKDGHFSGSVNANVIQFSGLGVTAVGSGGIAFVPSGTGTTGNASLGNPNYKWLNGEFSGTVTAQKFVGDGSGLTNLPNAGGDYVPLNGNSTVNGTITATDFVATSDERLKQNATTAPVGLVDQLRGVEFEWKEDGRQDAGVIAQEVERVLPHLVHDNGEHKAVNYNGLVAYLIEEIKDLKAQVEALK